MSHRVHWLKGFIMQLRHMRGGKGGGRDKYKHFDIQGSVQHTFVLYLYITPTSPNKLRAAASDNMSGANAVMITSPIDVKIEYGIKILQPCLECVVSTCGQKYTCVCVCVYICR